jgi:hypothetical protein
MPSLLAGTAGGASRSKRDAVSEHAVTSARRAFLHRLIDDAGLFPPAALSIAAALVEDRRARSGPHAWMLGDFVVTAARLGELIEAVRAMETGPLDVSLIVDATGAGATIDRALDEQRAAGDTVAIRAVEVKAPIVDDGDIRSAISLLVADIDASKLARGSTAYVEFAFGERWETRVAATIDALADARARSPHDVAGKIRCGGVPQPQIPGPEQLAFAIGTLRARELPFKATAGLHHPLRHDDMATSEPVHGFFNVVGAAVLDWALDLDDRTRTAILADRDAGHFSLDDDAFCWRDLRVSGGAIVDAREAFARSFGSCSFSEPVDDLIALGILEAALAR